ncbi:sensor histidine kinase [Nonomuraea sp. NPDC052265]|uniref:sensor histidine kinase n=1 Tax=Nonomuraea sp. NPDC052265 TaxID=3364374 RepID=UPI0037CBEA3C
MTGRLDRWEHLLERQLAVLPYLLLVIPAVLTLLTGGPLWTTLGLSAVAAAWIRFMPRGAVYVAGLVVLIGALCTQGMWFASFFGFIGFVHCWQYLKGRWRFAGVTAVAAITVTTYGGGLPERTPTAILAYLFFIAVIVVAVALFSFVGDVTAERSAEHKRMVTELEAAMSENAGLQAQLLVQAREAGVLDERQRMAAEIHDTLAQGLTGIITQLQAAQRGQDWRPHVDRAVRLARESLAEARRSLHAIGPGQLEAAPLPEALAQVVARWNELTGIRADLTLTGTVRPMHPEVEETLLRTAQEALANVAKHAHASRVGMTLSYMEDVITLDVRDDGIGFDPKLTAFGLTAMRKRVDRLAGVLEIESEDGTGTAISASLPAVPRD